MLHGGVSNWAPRGAFRLLTAATAPYLAAVTAASTGPDAEPVTTTANVRSARDDSRDVELLDTLAAARAALNEQIARRIVGQREIVDNLVATILAGGHALLVGVPGLAKTLLVQTVAQALDLQFSRVQFTPDLMPSDITGTELLEEDHATGRRFFKFVHGPVFGNVVLATQNPIEQEGTYPLPEAQLDRFMVQLTVGYPSREEEERIVAETTTDDDVTVTPVLTAAQLSELMHLVRRLPAAPSVVSYAVKLARSTRPDSPEAPANIKKYVSWGAGPRASQYLILGAKARAAMDGRAMPDLEDVAAMAQPVLSHRVVLNFQAEAEGISAMSLIGPLAKG
jgi:MoxR-like ATPase